MISQVQNGNYIADVLRGNGPEPFWYYILRRKYSREILDLVKFDNYEDAIREARKAVMRMGEAARAE